MAKINVYGTESYSTWICREPIEIDSDKYPELEGMSEDEMKDYIRENVYEMKPTNSEWYENLSEELMANDIRRDKIFHEENEITFDGE